MTHLTEITVRTYECDEYGHVNNAVYLHYLEHARVIYLQERGFPYRELREEGLGVVVTEIHIQYKHELKPGDFFVVHTESLKVGAVSGTFSQKLFRDEVLCAQAEVTWVMTDKEGRPTRLRDEHRAALE